MANSCNHFKALLKKNWILFKRSPLTSLCEIMIPIILVLILVLVRHLVTTDNEKETSYIANATNFTNNPIIPDQIRNYIDNLPLGSDTQIIALKLLYSNFHLKYFFNIF